MNVVFLLQFVESGNRPRDSSKLKKLLNMQKVEHANKRIIHFVHYIEVVFQKLKLY